MAKKFIKGYYRFFDKTLGGGVGIVVIITCIIASVGSIANYDKDILAYNDDAIIALD